MKINKENAWMAVAKELGIPVSGKAVRSGSGHKDIEIKEEFKYLRWLIVRIKHRETTSNGEFK